MSVEAAPTAIDRVPAVARWEGEHWEVAQRGESVVATIKVGPRNDVGGFSRAEASAFGRALVAAAAWRDPWIPRDAS